MSDPRFVAGATLIVERAAAEAVATLRGAGVRSILLKGTPQQEWLAVAGARRAPVDVDLLVDPTVLEAAGEILASRGYRVQPEVTPGVVTHSTLWTAPPRVPIELHWTLWGAEGGRSWAALVQETETVELAGESVEIPNEAARCLIVALHAANHGVGADWPTNDLGRAIEVAPFDVWSRAADLAREIGAEASLGAGLDLLPSGRRLRESLGLDALPLTERLALNIVAPVSGATGFYWLRRQEGARAKAQFVARKLVPPGDFMRFKYRYAHKGRAHLALAYLHRLAWLARWAIPGFRAWRRARAAAENDRSKQ